MLFVGLQFVQAQTVRITGTVTSSEDGMPLPGVSVVVKGTTVGGATDANGKYELNVPTNAQTLSVSYIGYVAQDLEIAGRAVIDIVMVPETKQIDEVIVVAYGTAKKSSYTGSAGTVKKEQLEKIQAVNFSKALEGAVAGVQVTGGTGQPGSTATIRIRGVGSVNASNDPLYVVDGAAYDGDINAIPNEDIESISVLKDAAAAALYGARGANGVIMVTTKKGKAGKNQVIAKVNYGVTSRAIPEYDRVSTNQWVEKQWEATRNYAMRAGGMSAAAAAAYASPRLVGTVFGGYNPYSTNVANADLVGADGKLNSAAKLLYHDDWNDALSQNGVRQDYVVSFSGGDDATTYYGSVNYLNEEGHVKWSGYERFAGRVGISSKLKKWLKVEANVSGNTSNQDNFLAEGTYTTNPFYYGRMMGPIYPIYQRDTDGNIIYLADGSPRYDIGDGGKSHIYAWTGHKRPYAPNSNLILTLPLDDRSNVKNQISARFSGEFYFLKNFTFKVTGSTDMNNNYYTTYQNNKYGDAESVEGRSTKEIYMTKSYTFNQVLTYNKEFGDHNVTAMVGHENYGLKINDLYATRTGFKISTTELVAGATAEGSSSYQDEYTLEGYFGQLSYSFADKYFLSGSYRLDGSSRFAKDSRWGSFWSLGATWKLIKEDFLANYEWLNDLKLQVSYGEQGNDAIGTYYGYQSLFSIDDRNNGTLNGAWYSQLPNENLEWEKNGNFNSGVSFSALNSRVRGSVEFFIRQSSNLLFQVPIPQSSGISSKWENIGTMKNTGVEIQLGGDVVKNDNFTWSMDLNMTHYKNEITKMPKDANGDYQEMVSGTKKLAVGHSIYDFWLRDYAGVDEANGNALYYYDMADGTKGTTNDRNLASYYYCGSAIPDIYGGYTNTFKFYGFDASIFVSYQFGGKFYDGNYAGLMHTGNRGTHWHKDIMKSWTETNTKTNVPRVDYNNSNQSIASSRWLTDATFISLRNVTLGYTFSKNLLDKVGIASVRVYASGDNLGLSSKRKGMDPQQAMNGTADYTYVPTRTISFGLNLTF
ncbi:SusC/RagA family TonB-linked outer membrane protein [Tenuifilaceae bacterium CYCD]|nr:SusC/RagA family TonB-linked outer membrane protein [Tenuifilaceae bacterium CYCD]